LVAGPVIAEKLHELGRIVHANDAASVEDVRRAIRSGADRISTDDPKPALAIRSRTLDSQ
jgi:glycerophosphoryl diester phosphodiesterase